MGCFFMPFKKEIPMKTILLLSLSIALCACSGKKPPQPHGTPFPINSTVQTRG